MMTGAAQEADQRERELGEEQPASVAQPPHFAVSIGFNFVLACAMALQKKYGVNVVLISSTCQLLGSRELDIISNIDPVVRGHVDLYGMMSARMCC